MSKQPKVAIIIINRDRPEITDRVYEQVKPMAPHLDKKIYVIEAGSSKAGQSQYKTHYFRDKHYKGRYYAFNRGLEIAKKDGPFDYYWFVVNDIYFPEGEDTLAELHGAMDEEPKMAQIAPGEPGVNDYHGCEPQAGRRWHKAATLHGLAILMSGKALETVGYCNPAFHYSQGAGPELAYKLYKAGWFLAYSDVVTLQHEGGSTYGKVVKISRHEYQRRARDFAAEYFVKHYGENWDEEFGKVLPPEVEENTFPWHRKVWESKLQKERGFMWFWKTGSWVKQNILRMKPRES